VVLIEPNSSRRDNPTLRSATNRKGLVLEFWIVTLFNRGVKRIHIDMYDFSGLSHCQM
jgi:hypothetical protein